MKVWYKILKGKILTILHDRMMPTQILSMENVAGSSHCGRNIFENIDKLLKVHEICQYFLHQDFVLHSIECL